ncbi:MAG: hypothetical protein QUS08_05570 [Methanothrix sp.]|nr:hypothetical protein [Methanothrix sp.]
MFLITDALAIGVSFSVEEGGESVGLYDDYDVSDGVSIQEDAEASFDDLELTDSREVSGEGDLVMDQTYKGSGGYTGYNSYHAEDVSGTVTTGTTLKPRSLDSSLSGGIRAQEAEIRLGISSVKGALETYALISDGSLNTEMGLRRERVMTESVDVSQRTEMKAASGIVESIAGARRPLSDSDVVSNTGVRMWDGILKTSQRASSDGSSTSVSQITGLVAGYASVASSAINSRERRSEQQDIVPGVFGGGTTIHQTAVADDRDAVISGVVDWLPCI